MRHICDSCRFMRTNEEHGFRVCRNPVAPFYNCSMDNPPKIAVGIELVQHCPHHSPSDQGGDTTNKDTEAE